MTERKTRGPRDKKKGNVWLDGSGKWQWEVTAVRRDGTKFRRHGSRSTEKDALSARDHAFAEYNRNEGANQRGYTVKTWCEYCLDEQWPNELAETTVDAYRHWLTTRVFSKIGSARLDALTAPMLQTFLNGIKAADGQHVAVRTKTALASALTRAVGQGFITVNPCRAVKLKDRSEIEDELEVSNRILSYEEMQRLLTAAEGGIEYWPILLGVGFGLRFGECLGLEWKHVDLEKRVIRIRQQLQSVKGKGLKIVPPKTKAGKRDLPISDKLLDAFRRGWEEARRTGTRWVCHRNGTQYSVQNGSVIIKDFVVANGFNGSDGKPIPTHHDFRSSYLTYLANSANEGQGVKPHVLMRIAGHSKLQTTMAYYIRATDDDLRLAMGQS